ncbi:plasmid maintenance system killer protein [Chelativorans sp. ZYF759]|uniref:type II toxin-antitoxin system RelE/ParE family toxin n=1 Tax=Chelativorans sp. ZYF759 TaxID=2692213 RepID=UPI00145CDE6C|nr:type II toxin-antitoxin system RelE/ParE family toxin [Chelativorans sp. ZYF759]NMG38792.1 plasmid maintenance system killer protein [Chelativorans sp. ZYF759]
MIKSFADRRTEQFYREGICPKAWRHFEERALVKLDMINHAATLDTLRFPPGNRLEKLKGDRREQWSIRINDQHRICFQWAGEDAFEVEIVDYH